MDAESPQKVVEASAASSGIVVNLHPLALLNMSDHFTRSKFTSLPGSSKRALLGTQKGRELAIANSFELLHSVVDGKVVIDDEFLTTRRDQCQGGLPQLTAVSQVFPTQTVVGWYSIGSEPTAQDVVIHDHLIETHDCGPSVFVLFDADIADDAKQLPFTVYESALPEGDEKAESKFVQLGSGIETGEAERVAVDGVTKEAAGESDPTGRAASLGLQRNAIAMLHDRVLVILKYISGVVDGTAKVDHDILRQVSALVATLPVMDVADFNTELETEANDVQLTTYLTSLLKQLEAFSEYSDKHMVMRPNPQPDFVGGMSRKGGGMPFGRTQRRGRDKL